jgi:hypothetical protein
LGRHVRAHFRLELLNGEALFCIQIPRPAVRRGAVGGGVTATCRQAAWGNLPCLAYCMLCLQ